MNNYIFIEEILLCEITEKNFNSLYDLSGSIIALAFSRVSREISFRLIIVDNLCGIRRIITRSVYYSHKEIAVLQLGFENHCPGFRKSFSFDRNNRGVAASTSLRVNLVRHLVQEKIKNERGKKKVSFPATVIRSSFSEGDAKPCTIAVPYGPLC